jgi:hypothetical protein
VRRDVGELSRRRPIAGGCRLAQPFLPLDAVIRHASRCEIHQCQIVLALGVPLFGAQLHPFERKRRIRLGPQAGAVK